MIRYHHTPIRMATIRNSDNSKCWQRWGETVLRIHFSWELHSLWKRVTFSYKTEHVLNICPALLGTYPRKMKIDVHNKNLHMDVHNTFICKSQKLETVQISFNSEMVGKKMYIHTMAHYTAIKRNKLAKCTTLMGLRRIKDI